MYCTTEIGSKQAQYGPSAPLGRLVELEKIQLFFFFFTSMDILILNASFAVASLSHEKLKIRKCPCLTHLRQVPQQAFTEAQARVWARARRFRLQG